METNQEQGTIRCLICDDPLAPVIESWVGPDGCEFCPDNGSGNPVPHRPVITVGVLA